MFHDPHLCVVVLIDVGNDAGIFSSNLNHSTCGLGYLEGRTAFDGADKALVNPEGPAVCLAVASVCGHLNITHRTEPTEMTTDTTLTRVRSIVGHIASRDRNRCSHDVTIDHMAAGIQRRRCVQCDHITIHHVGDAPTGQLFAIPRYADR